MNTQLKEFDIARWRQVNGFTIKDLAGALGISTQQLYRLERERYVRTVYLWALMAIRDHREKVNGYKTNAVAVLDVNAA